MGEIVPIACGALGEKKQTEIADYQHVCQPRKIGPVYHIVIFEIVLQMRFDLSIFQAFVIKWMQCAGQTLSAQAGTSPFAIL